MGGKDKYYTIFITRGTVRTNKIRTIFQYLANKKYTNCVRVCIIHLAGFICCSLSGVYTFPSGKQTVFHYQQYSTDGYCNANLSIWHCSAFCRSSVNINMIVITQVHGWFRRMFMYVTYYIISPLWMCYPISWYH